MLFSVVGHVVLFVLACLGTTWVVSNAIEWWDSERVYGNANLTKRQILALLRDDRPSKILLGLRHVDRLMNTGRSNCHWALIDLARISYGHPTASDDIRAIADSLRRRE